MYQVPNPQDQEVHYISEQVHTMNLLVQTQYLLSKISEQLCHIHCILVCTEYLLSTYSVHTENILVCIEYVLSMYSVQGSASCPLTLQFCNSVYFRVQTLYILGVAQCCIGA
jgi:hypothetical protein